MNKIFTISIFVLLSISTFAQYEVTRQKDTPINDGDVFTFNELGEELSFNITNNSEKIIYTKLKVVGLKKTTGEKSTICIFGNCYPPGKLEGKEFPSDDPFEIKSGQSSSPDYSDHFINNDSISATDTIEYRFKIYMLDFGGNEINDAKTVTFTYRYVPKTTSIINEFKVDKCKVYPTISTGRLFVETKKEGSLHLFDITGRKTQTFNLEKGENILNLYHLKSQIYFVKIADKQSRTLHTAKIIINK